MKFPPEQESADGSPKDTAMQRPEGSPEPLSRTESSRGLGADMWEKVGGADAIERERDSWT